MKGILNEMSALKNSVCIYHGILIMYSLDVIEVFMNIINFIKPCNAEYRGKYYILKSQILNFITSVLGCL